MSEPLQTSVNTVIIKRKVTKKKEKEKEDKEEDASCSICLDHFTKVIRQPITCPYCPHANCRVCTSTYLTTNLNDPHCMGCKREWNREFIDTHLTQTFRKGPLKEHRRKVLIDRERGRLPAMQIFVEAQIIQESADKRIRAINKRRRELKKQRSAIQAEFTGLESIEGLARRLRPLNQELATLKTERTTEEEKWRVAHHTLTGQEKTTRQFIMKCPGEECRGFLSTAWKCGTCQKSYCADCHAIKNGTRDEDHTCNPDAKATASMIRTETHPCPKCGIRISKIDGCDQMWCTSCQTTFSWNTGQVLLNTVVHNPHYYEYLRRANNGAIPREAGDVPCGGLPNNWQFSRLITDLRELTLDEKSEILYIHRCLTDIEHVRLMQFPLRPAANANQNLDIAYLTKKITEEEWGTALERTETTSERKREIGLILQTLLHVGAEKMVLISNAKLVRERVAICKQFIGEMNDLRLYSNKSLWQKGIQMGIVVPVISKAWVFTWAKKIDMKANKDYTEEPTPTAPAPAPVTVDAALPTIARPTVPRPALAPAELSDDLEALDDNEKVNDPLIEAMVMVENDRGQIIEMPYAQALAIIRGF